MADRIPPFSALRAFESTARLGSFRKAAEELHVTPAAVGQQVRGLEAWLGTALFRRLPRSLELTAEGEAMLPKVREGFENFATALALARAPANDAALAVSAPPTFATRWLLPRLRSFRRAHPKIELHLTSSAAMIGSVADASPVTPTAVDPDAPAASIHYGDGRYGNARVDRLFHASYVPICSPKLLEGRHALASPEDLRHHTLLHDDTVGDERARPSWAQWLKLEGIEGIDATKGPHFRDASLAIEAAADGLGVALALRQLVAADVREGRLAIPFDAPMPSAYAYYLVTPEANTERPDLAAFRTWLLAESAKEAA
jgi:LysR family glycine cleavage system transcriptional activator